MAACVRVDKREQPDGGIEKVSKRWCAREMPLREGGLGGVPLRISV